MKGLAPRPTGYSDAKKRILDIVTLPVVLAELVFRWVFLGFRYDRQVSRATSQVKSFMNTSGHACRVVFYGATFIDPKHLAIHFVFKTNAETQAIKEGGLEDVIIARCKEMLVKEGYPEKSLDGIYIGVESDENIEKAGGEYYYFK